MLEVQCSEIATQALNFFHTKAILLGKRVKGGWLWPKQENYPILGNSIVISFCWCMFGQKELHWNGAKARKQDKKEHLWCGFSPAGSSSKSVGTCRALRCPGYCRHAGFVQNIFVLLKFMSKSWKMPNHIIPSGSCFSQTAVTKWKIPNHKNTCKNMTLPLLFSCPPGNQHRLLLRTNAVTDKNSGSEFGKETTTVYVFLSLITNKSVWGQYNLCGAVMLCKFNVMHNFSSPWVKDWSKLKRTRNEGAV